MIANFFQSLEAHEVAYLLISGQAIELYFQTFAKRIGLIEYWKQNRWTDLCQPAPEKDPDAFTCQ
jgi:hypothetical protein